MESTLIQNINNLIHLEFKLFTGIYPSTFFRLRLDLEDVYVENLSSFVVDKAKLSLIGPTIAVNITVPTIYTFGYYNISGILGNMFPLTGAGPFKILIYGFRVYVHTVLGYSRGMYMKSFDLDFSLESIDIALENFMGNEVISKVMNQVNSNEFLLKLVSLIENSIWLKVKKMF